MTCSAHCITLFLSFPLHLSVAFSLFFCLYTLALSRRFRNVSYLYFASFPKHLQSFSLKFAKVYEYGRRFARK